MAGYGRWYRQPYPAASFLPRLHKLWDGYCAAASYRSVNPYRPSKSYPYTLKVRVSLEEKHILHRLARERGLSVSRFVVVTLTVGVLPPTLKDGEEIRACRFLLERAGVNLSLLSHRLKQEDSSLAEQMLREVEEATRAVKDVLKRLLEKGV